MFPECFVTITLCIHRFLALCHKALPVFVSGGCAVFTVRGVFMLSESFSTTACRHVQRVLCRHGVARLQLIASTFVSCCVCAEYAAEESRLGIYDRPGLVLAESNISSPYIISLGLTQPSDCMTFVEFLP